MRSVIRKIRRAPLGQSILEYAILIAVVAAAFVAMAFYVKRAVQGKIYMIEDQTLARRNQMPYHWHWVVPI